MWWCRGYWTIYGFEGLPRRIFWHWTGRDARKKVALEKLEFESQAAARRKSRKQQFASRPCRRHCSCRPWAKQSISNFPSSNPNVAKYKLQNLPSERIQRERPWLVRPRAAQVTLLIRKRVCEVTLEGYSLQANRSHLFPTHSNPQELVFGTQKVGVLVLLEYFQHQHSPPRNNIYRNFDIKVSGLSMETKPLGHRKRFLWSNFDLKMVKKKADGCCCRGCCIYSLSLP